MKDRAENTHPTPSNGPGMCLEGSNKPGVLEIDTHDLFRGKRLLLINHDDVIYRLQITQHNKLILTK